MTFDEAFERLIGHEGLYSFHPADPGAETMYGVTKAVAVAHGFTGEMQNLPLSKAKEIARAAYWDAVRADELPEAVRFNVFDGAYNSGVSQSVRWLQRAVGVLDDGKIGHITLTAASALNGHRIACRYNGHRLAFMKDLKTFATFGRGWCQRIAENLKAA